MNRLLILGISFLLASCSKEEINPSSTCIDGDCNGRFYIDELVQPNAYQDDNGYWHIEYYGPRYFTIRGELDRLSEDYVATISSINFPCFMAFRSSDITALVANSYTTVVFDSEDYDLGQDYDNTNGVFTAPVDGIYDFNAQLTMNNHTDDSPRFSLRFNTSIGRDYHAHWDLNEGQYESGTMEPPSVFKLKAQVRMQQGETIRLEYFQSDDTKGDIDASSYTTGTATTFFSGRLVVRTQ